MTEIVWKPSVEHPHGYDAWVGMLTIGAVFRLADGDDWYGYVEGYGRIGSCRDEKQAKEVVETIWHSTSNQR